MNHRGESEESAWGQLFSASHVSLLQVPSLSDVQPFKVFLESKRRQR